MYTPPAPVSATPPPDHTELLARLRAEQNYPLALGAGAVVAVVAAAAWAAVTVASGYQIGWMAVAVGFAVGYAVRLGKGIEPIYGYTGAVIALVSCILGNFFTVVGFVARETGQGIGAVLGILDFSKIPEVMISTASPMDLLFYGIAVYEGYRFSFRQISAADL